MDLQVVVQAVRLAMRLLELVDADELRPAEAVAAVGVAGLALRGEHEHRLAVLVLDAVERLSLELGAVLLELVARMRIERPADLVGRCANLLGRRALVEQAGDLGVVLGRKHLPVGHREPVDRIIRGPLPIDQAVDDVVVQPEGSTCETTRMSRWISAGSSCTCGMSAMAAPWTILSFGRGDR